MSQPTESDMLAQMARLVAEVEALKATNEKLAREKTAIASNQPFLKVSEKGAVSLYRINKQFPVTLYASQWETVLAMADSIRTFIEENKAHLASKPPKSGRPVSVKTEEQGAES